MITSLLRFLGPLTVALLSGTILSRIELYKIEFENIASYSLVQLAKWLDIAFVVTFLICLVLIVIQELAIRKKNGSEGSLEGISDESMIPSHHESESDDVNELKGSARQDLANKKKRNERLVRIRMFVIIYAVFLISLISFYFLVISPASTDSLSNCPEPLQKGKEQVPDFPYKKKPGTGGGTVTIEYNKNNYVFLGTYDKDAGAWINLKVDQIKDFTLGNMKELEGQTLVISEITPIINLMDNLKRPETRNSEEHLHIGDQIVISEIHLEPSHDKIRIYGKITQ